MYIKIKIKKNLVQTHKQQIIYKTSKDSHIRTKHKHNLSRLYMFYTLKHVFMMDLLSDVSIKYTLTFTGHPNR